MSVKFVLNKPLRTVYGLGDSGPALELLQQCTGFTCVFVCGELTILPPTAWDKQHQQKKQNAPTQHPNTVKLSTRSQRRLKIVPNIRLRAGIDRYRLGKRCVCVYVCRTARYDLETSEPRTVLTTDLHQRDRLKSKQKAHKHINTPDSTVLFFP